MSNASLLNPSGPAADNPAFIQLANGLVIPAVTDADVLGNLQQSVLGPNAGLAYFGSANFRDAFQTVHKGGSQTSPAAGTTIVTITPGAAGLWEVSVVLGVTGTTAAAVDSNNFALYQNAAAALTPITFPVQSTSGSAVPGVPPPVVLQLGATDTLSVKNIALATTGAVYAATIIARRVG